MTTRAAQNARKEELDDFVEKAHNKLLHSIEAAAEEAGKVIGAAERTAVERLTIAASTASTASPDANMRHKDDHDLLIALNTKMEQVRDDIKALNDNTSQRIAALEQNKLDTKDAYPVLYKQKVEDELLDHENRLRNAETNITRVMTWGGSLLLVMGVVEFVITIYVMWVRK